MYIDSIIIDTMNNKMQRRLCSFLRVANLVIIIAIYKYLGLDYVVIYGILNIDGHLDTIAESLAELLERESKKGGDTQ